MINAKFPRRFYIYSSRMRKMLLKAELKHPCWFMHIPKSGGSSIHEALRALIPLPQHIGIIGAVATRRAAAIYYTNTDNNNVIHEDGPRSKELFDMRELQLLTYMAHNDALIYGHTLFSKKADQHFGKHYKYVTVLRDPVERVISNYQGALHDRYYTKSFDEYLESEVARRHSTINLRYFSGIAEIVPSEESNAMAKAKYNQDKFSVIGFLDNLDDFSEKFENTFGSTPSIKHYNKARDQKITPSSSQMKKLQTLCKSDIELFLRARKIFK